MEEKEHVARNILAHNLKVLALLKEEETSLLKRHSELQRMQIIGIGKTNCLQDILNAYAVEKIAELPTDGKLWNTFKISKNIGI